MLSALETVRAPSKNELIAVIVAVGAVFGSTCWIFGLAIMTRDWLFGATALIVAVLVFRIATRAILRQPTRYVTIAAWSLAPLALVNLTVVNLRWDAWLALQQEMPRSMQGPEMPLWGANLFIVALFVFLSVLFVHLSIQQRKRQDSNLRATDSPRPHD